VIKEQKKYVSTDIKFELKTKTFSQMSKPAQQCSTCDHITDACYSFNYILQILYCIFDTLDDLKCNNYIVVDLVEYYDFDILIVSIHHC